MSSAISSTITTVKVVQRIARAIPQHNTLSAVLDALTASGPSIPPLNIQSASCKASPPSTTDSTLCIPLPFSPFPLDRLNAQLRRLCPRTHAATLAPHIMPAAPNPDAQNRFPHTIPRTIVLQDGDSMGAAGIVTKDDLLLLR